MSKIKTINRTLLNALSKKAKNSTRKRVNHNFHEDYTDPINRMLNALEPETYCQPHKHENPDKREVFIVLKGKMAVFFFDDSGNITNYNLLSPNSENYGVDIPAGVWHTLVSLESGSVAYEVKDGPYQKEIDKNFASWAPKEEDKEAISYLKKLKDFIA